MSDKPALLLLPNVLGDVKYHEPFLPESIAKAVASLDGLIAESEKGGRRFLGRFKTKLPYHLVPLALFNEQSKVEDIDFFLKPIQEGQRWGFVSDGGLPCIADPGAKLVKRAKQLGIVVQAFIGPCSITMALMLSGLSGQNFVFHGYLPKKEENRGVFIKQLEKNMQKNGYTQIFIEAPYRNKHTLETLMEVLNPETELSIAWDLTLNTQGAVTQKVAVWKKSPLPNLDKKCAIFMIGV